MKKIREATGDNGDRRQPSTQWEKTNNFSTQDYIKTLRF